MDDQTLSKPQTQLTHLIFNLNTCSTIQRLVFSQQQEEKQHKLQTYEENTIIKATTSTIRWLKCAKTLELDKTL
jgi:hypothetical protein